MAELKGGDPIAEDGWILVLIGTNEPVRCGDTVRNFRGGTTVVVGGRPPMHPSSTGRVWTEANQEFFPGVFDLVWKRQA